MVRLERLTVQGFKSFANKITIPFPTGFNIIAGPNGSGKSNVIDAITFVLGTSSARTIRAQKMQNLLFNGAKDKKPAEYCEVSMYFDNKDQKIVGEGEEVKITRRLNRSGVSIYKINGRTVTRTRILDVMINIGLSPEGYNIIMQGDVARIIEMSAFERRGIIDEIAGISEFDEKCEKAQREFEKVENMVRENMIVIAEKQRLVARLREEKANAEKYEKLNHDLRKSRASLLHTKTSVCRKSMQQINDYMKKELEEFRKSEKDFEEIEKSVDALEERFKSIGQDMMKRSRSYDALREIDKIRTEIVRKRDRLQLADRETERLHAFTRDKSEPVKAVLGLGKASVYGTLESLVSFDKQYSTAMEVAIGNHADDIVTKTDDVAIECIKHLKQNKIGIARFLPLNKLHSRKKDAGLYEGQIIGHALDLVKFEPKYKAAFEHVLGNVLIVDSITDAASIGGFKCVSLDGDFKEPSGAMTGGFYRKKKSFEVHDELLALEKEKTVLERELHALEEKLAGMKPVPEENEDVKALKQEMEEIETKLMEARSARKSIFEKRLVLQNSISKKRVELAKLEADENNMSVELEEYSDIKSYYGETMEVLQEKVRTCISEINRLGPINMKALEEFDVMNVEFEELRKKLDRLLEEKEAVLKIVSDVEAKRREKFMETLGEISKNFSKVFHDMTSGHGKLRLEDTENIDTGLVIEADLPGKGLLSLDSISGGEKTLTSLAFLFAIMEHYSAPFFILDEVDAALDKANTKKITDMIKKYSAERQFICITHNDITIQEGDKIFGVSMEEGISKIFGIEMPKARQ